MYYTYIHPFHMCVCVCVCVCACVRACVRACVCVRVRNVPINKYIHTQTAQISGNLFGGTHRKGPAHPHPVVFFLIKNLYIFKYVASPAAIAFILLKLSTSLSCMSLALVTNSPFFLVVWTFNMHYCTKLMSNEANDNEANKTIIVVERESEREGLFVLFLRLVTGNEEALDRRIANVYQRLICSKQYSPCSHCFPMEGRPTAAGCLRDMSRAHV